VEAGSKDADFAGVCSPWAARNARHCDHSADATHWDGFDTTGPDHFAADGSGSDGIHFRAPCCRSSRHSSLEA